MKYTMLLIILLLGSASLAQDKKDVKEADKLFKKEEYEKAMPMYRKFINMDANNIEHVWKYGSCMVMVTDDVDEALKYLLKAEKMGKKDEEIAYFIGRAYEKQEKYELAINYYERFIDATTKEETKKLKVKKRIRGCKKAMRKRN